MDRLEGGYLGAKPTWSTAASPGVWTLSQALARRAAGTWPATSSLFDPYFESVSLLLHMNGSNASTTFVDSSLGNLAVTANGNAQISTAQSKFGGSSGLFDGSGDGAIITTGLQNFAMTGNTYTLEAWIRPTATSGTRPIVNITAANVSFFGDISLAISGGTLAWESRHDTGSGFASISRTGGTIAVNTWYHVALSVNNGVAKAFLDGVQVGTDVTFTAPAFTIAAVGVGAFGNLYNISTECFAGYIDEVRITRGVARYTANFVVPGVGSDEGAALYDPYFDYVSLLLRCNGDNNSTTFTDSSNNALAITRNGDAKISTTQARFGGASAYFDGTGDWLSCPNTNAQFSFGTGDFTYEFWFNSTDTKAYSALLTRPYSSPGGILISLNGSTGDGAPEIYWNEYLNGLFFKSSVTGLNNGKWHHFAFVRTGTTCYMFIDGAQVASKASVSTSVGSTPVYIGTDSVFAGRDYVGYIDDVRITKGVCRYTTAFRPVGPYATSGKLVDPYLTSTSLLLPMTGDNGTTSFFDRSNNFLRATENGNAKVSTAISKFGAGAAYFDGTGDYLTSSAPNLSGSWTVECWLYPTTASQQTFISFNNGSNTGINLWFNSSLQLVVDDGANAQSAFTGGTLRLNSWNHVAIVRSGTTTSGYINGVLVGSNSFTPQTTSAISIGRYNGGVNFYYFIGYIDDVRLTSGVARYTSAFTPPERAFNDEAFNDPHYNNVSLLLHMDGTNNSTTFTDSSPLGLPVTANADAKISTVQSRFGGSSGAFDGTGDYLSQATRTDLALGTSDFTIETWVYLNSYTQFSFWESSPIGSGGGRSTGFIWYMTTNGTMYLFHNTANLITTSSAIFPLSTWTHVACCRSSGTTRLFVNGISVGSTSTTITDTAGGRVIGAFCDGGSYSPNGYLDEFRVTKGIARYTSNFTPPTLPFYNTTIPTADSSFSSVSLLLHMNGSNGSTTFTDSSSNGLAVTANGNAQISTAQSKFGGASGAFDGAGDFLSIASTSFSSFSTGAFTVECWVYYTSISTYAGIVDTRSAGGFSNWCLGIYTVSATNRVDFITAGGRLTSNTAISAATWTHIAVVRDSGIIKIYINGVADSATFSYGSAIDATTNTRIGGTADLYYLNGYIDDLRITKGAARYTSNFYIPRAAFPDA